MSVLQARDSPHLQIRTVSHHYDQKLALQNVSLDVAKSEILALLGPSGSGKSTLLAAIAGMVTPASGEILLGSRNLLKLPPEARGLGMVFQDYALWPHMTIAQNVAFPLRARKYPRQKINSRVEEALRRVSLQGFQPRRPNQLSGGQQQRVALARAIAAETELLLLDEPLSALDPATRSSVRGELAEILKKLDLTTIIVTHDREEAFELAHRVAILVDGQIQQHAEPEEIYERPANLTVAQFMGVNVLPLDALCAAAAVMGDGLRQLKLAILASKKASHVAIVPERTQLAELPGELQSAIPGRLLKSQYRGGEYRLQVSIETAAGRQIVEARSKKPPAGESVYIHFPVEAIHPIPSHLVIAQLETKERYPRSNLTALKEESV
jgi:putative spermidine/putrescine transport system ATP-binding protein